MAFNSEEKIESIFDKIKDVKIAVIGDFCLDAYWEIDDSTSEISVETGLETKPVRNQKYSPGGAGNVVANLVDIGVAEVYAFGVFGKDIYADKLLQIFENLKVNTSGVCIQEENWSTQVYLKPIQNGKELNRFDFGNFNDLTKQTADELIKKLEDSLPKFDAIVINQQVINGVHNQYFRDLLVALVSANSKKVFLTDSREYANDYKNTIRKINEYEVMKLSGFDVKPDDIIEQKDIIEAGKKLFTKWNKTFFVTCGEAGTIIFDNDKMEEIPALKITGKIDTVGAGDSFLSAASAVLATGEKMKMAAELGNLASGVTIQKLFCTGTASPNEIIKLNKIKEQNG